MRELRALRSAVVAASRPPTPHGVARAGAEAITAAVVVIGVGVVTAMAGEDVGVAAGTGALAGVSAGVRSGIGPRTGIAHGGATTISLISIRILTRTGLINGFGRARLQRLRNTYPCVQKPCAQKPWKSGPSRAASGTWNQRGLQPLGSLFLGRSRFSATFLPIREHL